MSPSLLVAVGIIVLLRGLEGPPCKQSAESGRDIEGILARNGRIHYGERHAHRYPPRTLDKGQGKQRVEAEAEGQWAEAEGQVAEVWAEAEGQANSNVDKGISATRWAFDSQRSFWESCDLCVWGGANEGRLQLCCGFGQVEQEPLCRKVVKNHFRCHAQLCWQVCSQEESQRCVERTVSSHSRGSLEWRRSENFEVTICSIFVRSLRAVWAVWFQDLLHKWKGGITKIQDD